MHPLEALLKKNSESDYPEIWETRPTKYHVPAIINALGYKRDVTGPSHDGEHHEIIMAEEMAKNPEFRAALETVSETIRRLFPPAIATDIRGDN